ncbi:hypothetical protein PGTUg99_000175 [Puccinia graminis f. sp. tritici]|uniref:Uncharacterized protein n=1 Tax=Puccinia graminis f. sp. tritici TaxID=56615 RepID=A0A5B0NRM9_PUCGR|nr:hypothetical protein PGTUg99_000175 [Puccinia graminis f. sp. tritici]
MPPGRPPMIPTDALTSRDPSAHCNLHGINTTDVPCVPPWANTAMYLTTGLFSFSAVGILRNLKSCKTASNNPFRQRNIPRLAQSILAFNRWSSSTGGYPSAQPASFQCQGVNKGKKRESVLEESSNHSPKRALNNHQSNSPMASTSQGRVNTVEMEQMTLGELFVERQLAEAQFDECKRNPADAPSRREDFVAGRPTIPESTLLKEKFVMAETLEPMKEVHDLQFQCPNSEMLSFLKRHYSDANKAVQSLTLIDEVSWHHDRIYVPESLRI